MEMNIDLRRMQFAHEEDFSELFVSLMDDEENRATIRLSIDGLRFMIDELIKFNTLIQVDQTLAPDRDASPTPSPTLPATATALHVAKQIGLVRWKKGGAVVQASTTEGMQIHLALSPALQTGLKDALATDLPEGDS